MPIKSKAQRRKFAELLMNGEISEEVYEEWNRGAGDKVLPERLHPKKGAKPKAKTRKARTSAKSKPRKKGLTRKKSARRKKSTRKTKSRSKS